MSPATRRPRGAPPAPDDTRQGVAAGLLGLVVIGAPLALGGVHLPARLALTAVALAALGAAVVASQGRRLPRLEPLGLALVVAVAATFAQWVPLPAGLAGALSPASAEARAATAAALGASPRGAFPLTLDGPRTAQALLSLVGLLACYLAARALALSGARQRLLLFLELAGLAVLAVGLVHAALGLTRLYGVYKPTVSLTLQFLPTSLVNPNHAAAVMLLASLVGAASWMAARPGAAQRFHLAVWLACFAGIVATAARAVLVLAVAGSLVLALVARRRARQRGDDDDDGTPDATRLLRVGLAAACLAVLAVLIAGPSRWLFEVSDGLASAHEAFQGLALDRWRVGAAVARDALWTGVGHGAFATASSAALPDWTWGFVDHAHNLVLQAVADWGLPVAALVLGLAAAGAWRGLRSLPRQSLEHVGLAVALGALVVQNLVEFSLSVPGVGYPAAVAAGALALGGRRGRSRDATRGPRSPAWASRLLAPAALVGLAALAGLHAVRQDAGAWEEAARRAVLVGQPGRVDREAMLAEHPSDYLLVQTASVLALLADAPEEARRLADRAVALAPGEPQTLRQQARVALAQGRTADAVDALVRLARSGASGVRLAVDEVLRHSADRELLGAFLGADADFVAFAVDRLELRGRHDDARELATWGVQRFPDSLELRERLAGLLLARGGDPAALDRLALDALVQRGQAGDDERGRRYERLGWLLAGHLARREGRRDDAWRLFTAAARLEPRRAAEPLLMAGEVLLDLGEPERLGRVLAALDALTEGRPPLRARYHVLASRAAEARGELREAIRHMQRALLHDERQRGYHDRLARLYDAAGDVSAAAGVRRRAEASGAAPRGAAPARP